MLFDLGNIYITTGVKLNIKKNRITLKDVQNIIKKHSNLKDDNKHIEDRSMNIEAINTNCGRIFTVHFISNIKLYCITDGLGTTELHTTILLSEEY